ncbi:MAG TPA: hypothetical protein PKK15_02540 [Kouleothrix sp.]|nr:hypothetical protein [Kouleothrix sp.]
MSEDHGYIYRVEHASEQDLLALIARHVGDTGWTFGGAAQWDFVAGSGRGNLRPIERYAAATSINVDGDFGHAFNADAEVRWKRRDDSAYDVLILSEQEQHIDGATPLCVRHWNLKTKAWEDGDWTIQRHKVAAIRQTAGRSSLIYIDYCAPNGAAQFQRLAGEQ